MFKLSYSVLAIIIVTTYNEIYLYYPNQWHQLYSGNKNASKILIIADPQLIGVQNELLHVLTPLTIWDSDNYLRKNYKKAVSFVQPDVVIFLGDLFDEGSQATDSAYQHYIRRLSKIFEPHNNIKYIWIPGDNDIGGEGMEPLNAKSISMFNAAFQQPEHLCVKNMTFYKINKLTQTIPDVGAPCEGSRITIGLSHLPLLYSPSQFADQIIKTIKPHIILAGHEHKSFIVNYDPTKFSSNIKPVTKEENVVFQNNFGGLDAIYEYIVPTCSYRMGTPNIGYGYIVIENKKISYTVLWTPPRFTQLFTYLMLCICVISYNTLAMCIKNC